MISPDRLRIALGAILLAVALLPIRRTLLDVHDLYTPARFDGLLSDATAALMLVTRARRRRGRALGVRRTARSGG